jgi:hypothetical protein
VIPVHIFAKIFSNIKGYHDDVKHSESLGLRSLSIDQNSKWLENMFWKLELFPPSGHRKETPTALDPLELTSLTGSVSLSLPEDGNRSGF